MPRRASGVAAAFASLALAGANVGGLTTASLAALTTSPTNTFAVLEVSPAAQSPPTSFTGGVVSLSWSASPTAATELVTYGIERRATGSGTFSEVARTTALSYTDTPAADGSYDYVVRAIVGSLWTDGAVRTAISDATSPTAASALAATSGTANGTVNLSWRVATDAMSGVAGYTVRFVQTTTCPAANAAAYPGSTSVGAATATTVGSLARARTYCFYLVALDAVGNQSGPSNVASAKAK
jgi:hypothetical protein